jgi:hypothetical protein
LARQRVEHGCRRWWDRLATPPDAGMVNAAFH